MNWHRHTESWSFILQRYLPRLALYSLVWEILQLPLYTLWDEPDPFKIGLSLMHCTVGDAMIGTAALVIALIVIRAGNRASWPIIRIGMWTVSVAVTYTILSERVNLALGNWSYSAWMPILPLIEIGLAPILQWVLVPLVALWLVNQNVAISSQ